MAKLTRNERRKAAQARLKAKQERFLARVEAQRLENVRDVVLTNLRSPIERNYFPQSINGKLADKSHRGYVCQNIARPRLFGVDDRGRMR